MHILSKVPKKFEFSIFRRNLLFLDIVGIIFSILSLLICYHFIAVINLSILKITESNSLKALKLKFSSFNIFLLFLEVFGSYFGQFYLVDLSLFHCWNKNIRSEISLNQALKIDFSSSSSIFTIFSHFEHWCQHRLFADL